MNVLRRGIGRETALVGTSLDRTSAERPDIERGQLPTYRLANAVSVQKPREFLRIMAIVRFSNQAVDTESAHEVCIRFFISRKQFGAYIQVRIHNPSSVKKSNADVQRCRVTVIDTEAIERGCELLDILGHEAPEPGVVLRTIAISELHAIAPYNHFTPKVCL